MLIADVVVVPVVVVVTTGGVILRYTVSPALAIFTVELVLLDVVAGVVDDVLDVLVDGVVVVGVVVVLVVGVVELVLVLGVVVLVVPVVVVPVVVGVLLVLEVELVPDRLVEPPAVPELEAAGTAEAKSKLEHATTNARTASDLELINIINPQNCFKFGQRQRLEMPRH